MIKGVNDLTYNFDYRVVRRTIKDNDGNPMMSHGEPMYEYWIQEIHFGAEGEIVAYAGTPEIPCGMDMDELRGEMIEQMAALTKPVIDWDMVKKETRNSSMRLKRAIRREQMDGTINIDGKSPIERALRKYDRYFSEEDAKS